MSTVSRTIIGIDPGSRITGYGIIVVTGSAMKALAFGHIPCKQETLSGRLHHIYTELGAILTEFAPSEAAIEQIFTCKNAQSALKLGHARGAALVALAGFGLEAEDYSARQVKQAVVGTGAADKKQVQHMIRCLLNLSAPCQADAADALAIAVCHANTQAWAEKIKKATTLAGAK